MLALRTNDKAGVDDALKNYSTHQRQPSSERSRQSSSASNEPATPLHLAVQCAPASIIEYILSKHKVDLSAKNRHGNTALHVAAAQGREDVVDLLLQQPDIDDSLVNHEGKQVSIIHDPINIVGI
jgi:oxysterol-binding protein 1